MGNGSWQRSVHPLLPTRPNTKLDNTTSVKQKPNKKRNGMSDSLPPWESHTVRRRGYRESQTLYDSEELQLDRDFMPLPAHLPNNWFPLSQLELDLGCGNVNVSLGRYNRWKTVPAWLTEHALHRSFRYQHGSNYGHRLESYDLPAVAVAVRSDNRDRAERIYINGRRLRHDDVFLSSAGTPDALQWIHRHSDSRVPTELKEEGYVPLALGRGRSRGCRGQFNNSRVNMVTTGCPDRTLEINLGANKTLTHLVIWGHRFDERDQKVQGRYVSVTKENAPNFVTRMRVSYRRHASSTWVDLGEMEANSDRVRPKVQAWSDPVVAQFVRIQAVKWRDRGDFRVQLWHRPAQNAKALTEEPRVRLQLTLPVPRRRFYLPQFCTNWTRWDHSRGERRPFVLRPRARRVLRADIRAQQDDYEEDSEIYDLDYDN